MSSPSRASAYPSETFLSSDDLRTMAQERFDVVIRRQPGHVQNIFTEDSTLVESAIESIAEKLARFIIKTRESIKILLKISGTPDSQVAEGIQTRNALMNIIQSTGDEIATGVIETLYEHTRSTMDEMTGAFRREAFFIFLKKALISAERHEKPVALIMIDLDHFKEVNDTYGHPAGDAVLKEVAKRIKGALRAEDMIGRFGRLGGEEFAVLLEGVDIKAAHRVATRLAEVIFTTPFTLPDGTLINKESSMGVAAYQRKGIKTSLSDSSINESMGIFVEKTDQFLYQAKETRNTIVIEGEIFQQGRR